VFSPVYGATKGTPGRQGEDGILNKKDLEREEKQRLSILYSQLESASGSGLTHIRPNFIFLLRVYPICNTPYIIFITPRFLRHPRLA
jgi:hypothetical protein